MNMIIPRIELYNLLFPEKIDDFIRELIEEDFIEVTLIES